jgi:Fic family protein
LDRTLNAALGLAAHLDFLRSAQEDYWNWDDTRRHPIPAGFTAEDAWQAITFSRHSTLRVLPFRTVQGEPFRYMLHDRVMEDAYHVDALGSSALGLVDPRAAAGRQAEHLVHGMMEEAVHSSLIEGAVITRQQGRDFLEQGRRPKTLGERMVFNNFRTIEMLATVATQPLTVPLICDIHRMITDGTLEDPADGGRIQRPLEKRVVVGDLEGAIHQPPAAEELPDRLDALCAFANAETPWMPAVFRSVLLHFQLGHDHPFVDGNGRTARALFYWSMLRREQWMVRYLSISPEIHRAAPAYARAYVNSEQTGDVTYFLLYHLRILRRAMEALAARIRERQARLDEAERRVDGWPELNLRQRLIVTEAIRHPDRSFDARTCASRHGVTLQTAHTDLRQLTAWGLLTMRSVRRRFVFTGVSDLAARIRRGAP